MSGMNIRRATEADQPALRELWEDFESEIPAPPEFVETWDEEWQDVSADIGGRGAVFLAEDDEGVAGALRATMLPGDVWHVVFAHVRPRVRRQGVLKQLMAPALAEGRSRGSNRVTLDVMAANRRGRDRLETARLRAREAVHGGAAGSRRRARPEAGNTGRRSGALLRADRRPRRGRAGGREVPAADRPLGAHRRRPAAATAGRASTTSSAAATRTRFGGSAREVSLALGAIVLTLGVEESAVVRYVLWDRGGVADEYASVPGATSASSRRATSSRSAANPTVAQRLTGADPARVRAVARTASSTEELPAPDELHAQLAEVLGVG